MFKRGYITRPARYCTMPIPVIMMYCLLVSSLFAFVACATEMPELDNTQNCVVGTLLTHILQLERTVASLSTELRSMASSQESMKSALRDKDALLTNITRSLAAQASGVAYSVALQSDIIQICKKPLTFDTVDYNQGNAYNMATGMFTAPVSGTYVFWANVMVGSTADMGIRIFKGSILMGRGYINGQVHGVASITTTTHLNKGEQVWMDAYATATTIPLRGDACSSYGGTLIHVS